MRTIVITCVALALLATTHAQNPDIRTIPVQRGVHMLVGDGGNIAVQIGGDGVLLVDTQTAATAADVMTAVRRLSPRPLHTIVNTHAHPDHTAGNAALVTIGGAGAPQPVRVMGHEHTFNRMMAAAAASPTPVPMATLPMSEYFTPTRDFYLNGEAIILYHLPNAHTDGDTMVYFRGSDVLAVGDVFTPDHYPMIDVESGGTVNGIIAALNRILEIAVPARFQEGGTYVIPGHGRICDEAEVVEYRDMVTIIRDRVEDAIRRGRTLEQIKAERPTRDFDPEYGATSGVWTTNAFVEAVYRTLVGADLQVGPRR